MPKPVTGLITFGGSPGPLSTGSLDTNYNAITAAINDFATYGNFLQDTSGAANSIVVATPLGLTASFQAGLRFEVKVANTNTGATTLAANALPATNVLNPNGQPLTGGQLVRNGVYAFEYDGANYYLIGGAISWPSSISVNVVDQGADPTGAADSTTAITNAIAAVALLGGGEVYFPQGTFKHTGFTVSASGVILRGAGFNGTHDGGNPVYPTTLSYNGTSGGTAVTFTTVSPATNPMCSGVGLRYIKIEGNALAGTGLLVQSVRGGIFDHVYVKDTQTQAYLITCLARAGATEATDTQDCIFNVCTWRNIDSVPAGVRNSHGMVLTSATPGSNGANTSFNTFRNCEGQCYNGINWILADADNNTFWACRAFRTNGTAVVAVSIRGADTNHFWGLSAGGLNGIEVRGTASGYFANPVSNTFFNLDDSNGTVTPTFDASCQAQVHFAIAGFYRPWSNQLVLADTAAQAEAQRQLINLETLRIFNGSQNHSEYIDGLGNTWAFDIDGSGNFRMHRIAGSGGINIGNNTAVGIGFYGAATVAQYNTGGSTAAFVQNAGTAINTASTFDGYTVAQICHALRLLGLMQ